MKLSRLAFVILLLPLLAMMGCTGDTGPAGPAGEDGTATCAACHNETNLLSGKRLQWMESVHGTGEAYVRGSSSSCAGCHSGNAFALMIEAGLQPNEVTEGDAEPTRQDCRACHMIHDAYTLDDFAVRTSEAVSLYAIDGTTYDGGLGNLCVNCHQPRRVFPEPNNGVITGISGHWGPHHGPQSAMILGVAGADSVVSAHFHAQVTNTCVGCHMGDEDDHTFEPSVSRCQACHPGATNFDINGVQTEVAALITQLGDLLVQAQLIDQNNEDGHPIVSEAPLNHAIALWNWIYVAHEDKSLGVHNAKYAKDLLNYSISLMQLP